MTIAAPEHPFLARLLERREVRALAQEAEVFGVPAHLVGGAVRDALLRRRSTDLDAVVAGRGEEVAEGLAARLGARWVRLGGERFAAQRLVSRTFVLDIWDRATNSLHDDLARRDFTINAIALPLSAEPESGAPIRLIDPFDGQGDLRKQRLRAVTQESFTGDPLRVLRLPRFALQLGGFGPDRHTLGLARESAPELPRVSAERVREELSKLFEYPGTERALSLLHQLGLYPQLWLGLPLTGRADNEGNSTLRRARKVLERLPDARQRLETLSLPPSTGTELSIARQAIALRALAESAETALRTLRETGYVSRADTSALAPLLRLRGLPLDEPARRTFLHQAGEPWRSALLLVTAEALAEPGDRSWAEQPLAELARVGREDADQLIHPPKLLDGHQVQELLGIRGQALGQALEALEQAWVQGEVNTPEEAKAWLLRRVRAGS